MLEVFMQQLAAFKTEIRADHNSNNTASLLLFKDYLSKLYKFYEAADLVEDWKRVFFDPEANNLVGLLAPDFKSLLIDIDFFRLNLLNDTAIGKSIRQHEYIYVYYGLYWKILKNRVELKKYTAFDDPYDSVFMIIKRGNHITRGDMAYIDIDRTTVRADLGFRLPSLSLGFLDFIDEKSNRVGSFGIPNQQRVNELWEEFQNLK